MKVFFFSNSVYCENTFLIPITLICFIVIYFVSEPMKAQKFRCDFISIIRDTKRSETVIRGLKCSVWLRTRQLRQILTEIIFAIIGTSIKQSQEKCILLNRSFCYYFSLFIKFYVPFKINPILSIVCRAFSGGCKISIHNFIVIQTTEVQRFNIFTMFFLLQSKEH